jgi:4-hydroxy 2-oxovalerate aldolase
LNENQEISNDRTIQPDSRSLDRLYETLDRGSSLIVGMIDYGTCGIDKIIPCKESYLDGIRVIFKKDKRKKAIEFCRQIKALGYKVFVQAVSITSYSDEELEDLLEMVNELEPYAFSLVDTYGLLHKNQLIHYFDLSDKLLKPGIGLGYHSHNNFQLAYANCVELIEKNISRLLLVDGSLYGMGKSAGNAPTELIATYLNDTGRSNYKVYHLLEAIDTTILDIRKEIQWGYSFKFFVSASNDCHPNYVSYLMDKKKLSVKSINAILEQIDPTKKLNYDRDYIENLYVEFQKKECDDKTDRANLIKILKGRKVLLIGPGKSVERNKVNIEEYQKQEQVISISVNYIPDLKKLDGIFISNAKRYVQLSSKLNALEPKPDLIVTSNVTSSGKTFPYNLNYSSLLDEQALIVDNPMIMFMHLLKEMEIENLALVGFDGYTESESANYANPNMEHAFSREKANDINRDVVESIKRLSPNYPYFYLTESLYQK